MKLGIMQPYFFPYRGQWQLIDQVDRVVIYDDVNYIKGGWINRNRILINGAPSYITGELKLISSEFQHNDKRKALCLPDFPSCHLLLKPPP